MIEYWKTNWPTMIIDLQQHAVKPTFFRYFIQFPVLPFLPSYCLFLAWGCARQLLS